MEPHCISLSRAGGPQALPAEGARLTADAYTKLLGPAQRASPGCGGLRGACPPMIVWCCEIALCVWCRLAFVHGLCARTTRGRLVFLVPVNFYTVAVCAA